MPSALPLGEPWPESNRLQAVSTGAKSFHAYVHIPFCEVRCGYCDFNTYTASELGGVKRSDFHRPLIEEVLFSAKILRDSNLEQQPLSSVFFGGGTPSLFAATQVGEILSALNEAFGFLEDCEVTLEANPESASEELLESLAKAGVNRISVGVQSFDPGVLSTLDRVHDAGKVREVIAAAKSLGYRVSADLIYGTPGETLESWRETLLTALELGTEHISAYSLIVEPGTALARKIKKGELEDVDEDLNAEKYELTTELLEGAGYGYYETSNFGKPSIHNLAYWTSQNWWGYGPGAHSHISGSRFWNHKHPQRYADALPASPAAGMEVLSLRQRLEEELLLGLRLSSGVRANLFDDLEIAQGKIDQLVAENLLEVRGERVLVTKEGRLLVDRMVVDFLS